MSMELHATAMGGGMTGPGAPYTSHSILRQSPDILRTALTKACAEMESLFICHLLKEMRASVPQDGLIHGGAGEDIFTSLMDGEMARQIALERGLGLAKMLERQLGEHLFSAPTQAAPAAKAVKGYQAEQSRAEID